MTFDYFWLFLVFVFLSLDPYTPLPVVSVLFEVRRIKRIEEVSVDGSFIIQILGRIPFSVGGEDSVDFT